MAIAAKIVGRLSQRVLLFLARTNVELMILVLERLHQVVEVRRVRAVEFVALGTLIHRGRLDGLLAVALEASAMSGLDSHFRSARSCRLNPLMAVGASRSLGELTGNFLIAGREGYPLRHLLQVGGMREVGSEICSHLRFRKAEQRGLRLRNGPGFVADAAEHRRFGKGFKREVVTWRAADMPREVFHIRLGDGDRVAPGALERLVLVFAVREARELASLR